MKIYVLQTSNNGVVVEVFERAVDAISRALELVWEKYNTLPEMYLQLERTPPDEIWELREVEVDREVPLFTVVAHEVVEPVERGEAARGRAGDGDDSAGARHAAVVGSGGNVRVYVLLDVRSDDGVEVVGVYERERDALKDAWEMLVGDTTAFRWDGDEDTCPRDQTWVVSESLVASGGKEKAAFVVSGYDLIASSGEDA